MISLDELARCIGDLPPFSSASLEALELLDGPDVDYALLAHILERDPALVVRALRLANSPFYGLTEQIGTAREACVVLGKHALRQLITTAAVMNALGEPRDAMTWHRLWRHSTAAGVAARALAVRTGSDLEAATTAGLLHDLGQLLLVRHFPQRMKAVAGLAESRGLHWSEAERSVFGFDHGEVGARVAARWHLPAPLAFAIAAHHDPDGAPHPLVDLVHVADVLCQSLDSEPVEAPIPPLSESAWARLGIQWPQVREVLGEVEERIV